MIFILIISLVFSLDLFLGHGTPATFDGYVHLANIAQFHHALADSEFPARWGDGFANYGMPIPIIAQQATSYLGALFTFITHDVTLSYALVVFTGALLSNWFFYRFLRIYTDKYSSLLGVFVFNIAPYRIINIYIRGSLPEFFGSVFLPLMLIGLHETIKEKNRNGPFIISVATAGILLTHPFLFVIYSFIFVPYAFFVSKEGKNIIASLRRITISLLLGFGIAAYFIIPLFAEIKYFYYGQTANHFVPSQYLTAKNFFDPNWYYNYGTDIYTRGHFIKPGIPELFIVAMFVLYIAYRWSKKHKLDSLQFTLLTSSILVLFLSTGFAVPLYERVNFLGGIQHAWRMLSAFIFIPPIILSLFANKKNPWLTVLPLIIIFMTLRFPQIYGKNYISRPQESYYKMPENLHGTIMNTIWTSNTTDYPQQKEKAGVFEGTGKIIQKKVKNASRSYTVDAKTDIKMVDYTFYYPGWRVYIDGKKTDIQFQDPSYRGVITYSVPKGKHQISVVFEETALRIIANAITILSLANIVMYLYLLYGKSPDKKFLYKMKFSS